MVYTTHYTKYCNLCKRLFCILYYIYYIAYMPSALQRCHIATAAEHTSLLCTIA